MSGRNGSPWREGIRTVRIVVHNTGRMGRSLASDNHCTQYLILGPGRAVQVNMRLEEGYINGDLSIDFRQYERSNTEIIHFPYDAVAHFSPEDVKQRLLRAGFGDYTFTAGGLGCRYWNILAIYMYERQGWLPQGSAMDLHARLPFQFSTLRPPVPWPIQQGTFDDETAQEAAIASWSQIEQQIRDNITRSEQLASQVQWYATNATTNTQQVAQLLQVLANQGIVLRGVSQAQQYLQTIRTSLEGRRSQLQALQQSAAQGRALLERRQQEVDSEEDE